MMRSLHLAGILLVGSAMTVLIQPPSMFLVGSILAPHTDPDYWDAHIYWGAWIAAFIVSATVILLLNRLSRVAH